MKKTLITLLALSGLAIGETPAEYNDTYSATSWSNGTLTLNRGLDLSLDYWSIEATIYLDCTIASGWGTRIFYSNNDEEPGNNAFFMWHGNGNNTPRTAVKFRGFGFQKGQSDHQVKDTETDSNIAYSSGTYTFNYTKDGDTITLSVYDEDYTLIGKSVGPVAADGVAVPDAGTISKLYSDITSQMINDNWYTMPIVTISTVKPIPEPTTATLSLLALAGLAARRRRK